MTITSGPDGTTNQPTIYYIRIQGNLGPQLVGRFEELSIRLEDDGTTLLIGPVVDQAALHGILRRIRDLGITLISINSTGAGPNNSPNIGSVDQPAG